MLAALAFYVFAFLLLAAGLLTVLAQQSGLAILGLLLAFLAAAGLFSLLGAEIVAILLVLVTAVVLAGMAVLAVQQIEPDFSNLRPERAQYLPYGAGAAVVLLLLIVPTLLSGSLADEVAPLSTAGAATEDEVAPSSAIAMLSFGRFAPLLVLIAVILGLAGFAIRDLTRRQLQLENQHDRIRDLMRDPGGEWRQMAQPRRKR